MKSIKTRCIIIKRMDLGETDRLITLLSDDLGKVRALNRGARKPLSKLAGHLEPYTLTECQLEPGKSFYRISAAATIEPFGDSRTQLNKTGLIYYLLEMVDALLADEQPQPAIFQLLDDTLHLINDLPVPVNKDLIIAAFTLKLMTELGYRPELHHCLHCQIKIEPKDNRFSVEHGGLLGSECQQVDKQAAIVSPMTIKAMRLVIGEPIRVVNRLILIGSIAEQFRQVTADYLNFHTGRELRSSSFLHQSHRF